MCSLSNIGLHTLVPQGMPSVRILRLRDGGLWGLSAGSLGAWCQPARWFQGVALLRQYQQRLIYLCKASVATFNFETDIDAFSL